MRQSQLPAFDKSSNVKGKKFMFIYLHFKKPRPYIYPVKLFSAYFFQGRVHISQKSGKTANHFHLTSPAPQSLNLRFWKGWHNFMMTSLAKIRLQAFSESIHDTQLAKCFTNTYEPLRIFRVRHDGSIPLKLLDFTAVLLVGQWWQTITISTAEVWHVFRRQRSLAMFKSYSVAVKQPHS